MISIDSIFIIGLALFGLWCSYRIGRIRGRMIERATKQLVKPVCPCGHSIGTHVDGKSCQAQVEIERYSRGYFMDYQYKTCACTRYYGPTVITDADFFHPGVADVQS